MGIFVVSELAWRVFSHVSIVFLIPSTLLGTISPVVAKMALERGLPTGRTVGDIYAWGAAGSIAGTFLAGFYLIAAMGTIAIIWTVGAALLLMAIFYGGAFVAGLYFRGGVCMCAIYRDAADRLVQDGRSGYAAARETQPAGTLRG